MTSLSQIGQYRVEAHLGTGEWTETYHAYDIVLRRPVALKLLRAEIFPAETDYHGFLTAAQLASELVHPKIAWIWSTGELENRFFLAERYAGGASLAELLTQSGPIPWDQALQIIEQIAQAIEFAEERQWIHGRVTPHNILLAADQGAILSDYGLQKAVRQVFPGLTINLYDARYLAPEMLQKQPPTARADQYALACTLVEMFTGKNPFQAASLDETFVLKTTEVAQSILPLEILPRQVAEIVEQALHAEPSRRFANSLDFVSALDRAIRSGLSDVAVRQQHEETLRRWKEEGEVSRKEEEEADRQAALEQARQEIYQRAHLEAEKAIGQLPLETSSDAELIRVSPISQTSADTHPSEHSLTENIQIQPRSTRTRRPTRQRARLWLLFLFTAIILAFSGYWIMVKQPVPPTPTHSPNLITTMVPAIQAATVSPTSKPTLTKQNASATVTIRPTQMSSPTITQTPTVSQTPTPSQTSTIPPPSPTSTRERPEKET